MEIVNYRTNYIYLGPAANESKMIVAEITPYFEDYLRKIDYQFFDLHFFHAIEFSMSMGGYRISVLDKGENDLHKCVGPAFVKMLGYEIDNFSERIANELTISDALKLIRFDTGRHSFKYLERIGDRTIVKSDYDIVMEEIFDLLERNPIVKAKDVFTGEWVEGSIRLGDDFNVGQGFGHITDFFGNEVKIVYGTCCGYSGFIDKNGRKIFIGDILQPNREVRCYGHWKSAYVIEENGKRTMLSDACRCDLNVRKNIHDK